MPKYTLNRAKKRCCQWQGERIRKEEKRFYAPSKTFFQFTTLNSRFSWSTSHVFDELYDQRMINKDPRVDLRHDDRHHQGQRTREWILKKSRLPFKSSSFSVQANAPTTLVSVLLAAFLFLGTETRHRNFCIAIRGLNRVVDVLCRNWKGWSRFVDLLRRSE